VSTTTAGNAPDGKTLMIFNRARYWSRFPAAEGQRPWEGTGVTAADTRPGSTSVTAISRDRYWVFTWPDGAVTESGMLKVLWAERASAQWHRPVRRQRRDGGL
jgi:hypothetical protein